MNSPLLDRDQDSTDFLKSFHETAARQESERIAALQTVQENTKALLLAAAGALGEICASKTNEDCLAFTRTFNGHLEEAREAVSLAVLHMPA